jgi:hypothetical protein
MGSSPASAYPEGTALFFVRSGREHIPGGRVHVEHHYTDAGPLPEGEEPAEMLAAWLLRGPLAFTLCGLKLALGGRIRWDADGFGHRVDRFDDKDLCWRCHRALGDQAHRAFEHAQPDDPEEPR